MNVSDLMPFCDKSRKGIEKPWSVGAYTYATDGRIIIRVPRRDDVQENDQAPKDVERRLFSEAKGEVKWPLSEINYILIPEVVCPECNGVGKLSKCPECGGLKIVVASTWHNDYDVECATCEGTGQPPKCEMCEGSGKILNDEPHNLGGVLLRKMYLELLKTLPDCVLHESSPNPLSPVYFQFNGGDGMMMPMRPPREA